MNSNSSAMLHVVGAVIVFMSVIFALWILVALGRVFSKLGEPDWKAWVPFLNIVTLLNLAGLNVAFIAIYLIPGVSSFSPIVTTLAAHQINLRFGKGSAHTVLALLLFPVWASVLGFGSAVPIGGRPAIGTVAPVSWEQRTTVSFAPQPIRPPDVVFEDNTVVAHRNRPRWMLQIEGGEPIALTKSTAILGRNPTPRAQFADSQMVALADPSKTVSKTHARLSLAGETWSITDIHSTNGVFLVSDFGDEVELEPGVPTEVGDAFRLGDLILRIAKGK